MPQTTANHRPSPPPPVGRLDALVAFARAYGSIRYFHPTAAGEAANWAQVVADGVVQVERAHDYAALQDTLTRTFAPYTQDVAFWLDSAPEPPGRISARSTRVGTTYWQHQGYEGTPISLFRPPYSSARITPDTLYERRFSARPQLDAPARQVLVGPLRMRMPLALPATAPRAARTRFAHGVPIDTNDLNARPVRLALIIDVWSVLRHFYPYQPDLTIDWEQLLRTALAEAEHARTDEQLLDAVRTLTRGLRDGHAKVRRSGSGARSWLPLRLECAERTVVVTASEVHDVRPGDVVEAFDGEPAFARVEALAERFSGTLRWRLHRACTDEGTRGLDGTAATLLLRRNGEARRAVVRYQELEPIHPARPEPYTRLRGGLRYIDLTRTSWSDLQPKLADMAGAHGLVFDMRGYPVHNDTLIDHLLTRPEDAKWMHVPQLIAPGGEPAGYTDLGWNREPAQPNLAAPAVFLISAAAISYAESILAYVRTHRLGLLIGEATAGANGDIVRHDSLGGVYVVFSGMRVTTHDGRPFHNIGIAPDVRMRPTLKGMLRGHDELLARGIAEVRRMPRRTSRRVTR